MIKISEAHRNEINEILRGYNFSNYESVIKQLTPILKHYHPLDPAKVGKRLLSRLFGAWLNKDKEAIVHYWTLCQLVHEYQYPSEHLDVEVPCGAIGRKALAPGAKDGVAHADVVVYGHESRRPGSALIAIECRELRGPDGAKQAASYSRALQSRYHLFTNSDRWNAFETQPHPVDGIPVSDIPRWVGYKPLAERLPKKHLLPPLTDEKQLRDLVKVCHDKIHSEGLDPATAFDELVKLLFVKVYDEQELPKVYEFSVLAGETEDETGAHIRELLKQAKQKSKYKELFSEPGDDEFSISNSSIRKVVETFQGFSFTGNSIIGIDAKGTVYENMVGSTFRGELGQYFTPRKMVEFMVDLLQPTSEDVVLDPSSGSGGFLIYVLRKVATLFRKEKAHLPQHQVERHIKEFVDNNIRGTDINPRMVRAARMNMIMHGDGWSGIQRGHGLQIHKANHPYKTYSLILSNPPFAGFETDESVLNEFEVGKNEAGKIRGVNRAIVFVEQIINLLDENGRAGLVLPQSIFENASYSFSKLRQIIFEKCEILALIGLPKTAFFHTDCAILGDLLFIKKKAKPRANYNVFLGWAEEVGYNTLGHNIEANDFPAILKAYRKRSPENLISVSQLKAADDINPWHFHPRAKELQRRVEQSKSTSVPLSELVSVYNNRISRKALKQTPNRVQRYVEVRDFDPETGKFTSTEHKVSTLPSRATYELNGEELILLPNAKNSLESRRKVIKVGEEMKGLIMTNRFLPLRPRVNPDYLVMMLNTDFVKDQLIAICRGAGSPDFRESQISEVMIPVPDSTDLSSIDSFMENIADHLAEKKDLQTKIANVESSINGMVKSIAEGNDLGQNPVPDKSPSKGHSMGGKAGN
jgi:type I restriction-modification system DNA methylase subunit